jgi:hypothetical protein
MTGFESKRTAARDKMELADAYALTVAETPHMPTPLERRLAMERIERARNALKAALEQQAEPVAWDKPSASFNDWWDGDYDDSANRFEKDSAAYWAWAGWQAAQRPWVGLTDEAIWQIATDCTIGGDLHADKFARAIEAKLKEKNSD